MLGVLLRLDQIEGKTRLLNGAQVAYVVNAEEGGEPPPAGV
jgi:hypothetical protein